MNRINLWSSPRNISTALMYSFAQRPDTTVVDEPLYAHYLSKSNTQTSHPGHADIMRSQSADGQDVVDRIILGNQYETEVVIFKQMTHHLIELNWNFLHQTKQVLLIRDPRAILASYTKVIRQPTPYDIGIPQQDRLYEYLKEHQLLSAIVDAKRLLLDPKTVLTQLCGQLDIPFDESMLSWTAGARPEDGVWAPYWYSNVHRSTGFKPYTEKEIVLTKELEEVAQTCLASYDKLLADDRCL
ncbi:MAG: hypothetical protein AAGJ93_10360 [Bacteroidota bacterium]